MKKALLSSASSTLLAALVLSTAACDFFNDPPPRYNTVVGGKRAPILNPGGEGPATIPLQQFEETDRYTMQYPSAEDMQALEEAQGGMMEPLPPESADMPVEAAAPAEVMGEYSADMPAEEGPRRRPLAQAEISGTEGFDQQPLQSFDDVGRLPTDTPSVAMMQPAPTPVVNESPMPAIAEQAPVVASDQEPVAPTNSAWSDNPNPPADDAASYPKLSSVPSVPANVKQNAAATRAEFADVAAEGAAQTAGVQHNQDAVEELNRALQAEAEQHQAVSTYQPEALPPQQQVEAAPLEQPLPPQEMAALPPSTEPVPPAAPAPQWQPVPPAPMDTAPAQHAAPQQQPATPISNFQMPEPTGQEQNYPVATGAPTQDMYNAPADGLAPIQLVPPSQMGSPSRPTLPPSRYEARRMGSSTGGPAYRHY